MTNCKQIVWKLLGMLLLCIPLCAPAQDPNYVCIDKTKGLPSNTVYDLLQDSAGFVWMVTQEGLCRYDGYRFVSYHNRKQTSMAGSHLSQDVFGRIWYENFDGYLYYVENDSLKALNAQQPIGFSNYALTERSLMVISEKGLDVYDLQTLRIRTTYPLHTIDFFNAVQTGELFYVGCDSVFVFGDEGLKNVLPRASGRFGVNSGFLVESPDHAVLQYGRYKGEQTCFRTTGQGWSDFFRFSSADFIQAAMAASEYTWFCTTSGVFAHDKNGRPLEDGRVFFAGKSISGVLHDREDNYWFSTLNEGLMLVNDFGSRNYFPSLHVSRFFIRNDSVYCGTVDNKVYNASLQNMEPHLLWQSEASHSVDFIGYCDAALPLACSSDSFRVINGNRVRSSVNALKDMVAIAPGIYAVVTSVNCGLHFTTPSHEKWNGSWMVFDTSDGLQIHQMVRLVRGRSVAWDSATATIYFATNKGLFASTYNGSREIKNGEESMYFSVLEFCGDFLFGLSSQGEILRVARTGECTSLNDALGIPMNELHGMEYREGQLYLFSSSDVIIMDPSQPEAGVKRIPAFVSDIYDLDVWHGHIYLATPSGILALADHEQRMRSAAPRFVINYITVDDAVYRTNSLPLFHHEQNTIEIAYSVLAFKAGVACPLYYKIDDHEWVLCPADARTLTLASLAPGNYTILFRLGEYGSGYETTALQFTIDSPWWKKWWALTIYVGVFLVLTWLLYKRQLLAQEKKSRLVTERIELEKNLDRSVLTSIRSQMNPHFFYNALNTIQSYIYSNDRKNAGSYLSKFSRLTRMILEMSEQELILLEEEITACRLYLELEQARFNDDFSFSIETKNVIDATQVRLPPMLLQPYIENAIKHGLLHKKGEKRLELLFELTSDQLRVTISDNGIGRERSAQLNAQRKDRPKSFSSDANGKRLELLNRGAEKTYRVLIVDRHEANGQAGGTTVIIDIPI